MDAVNFLRTEKGLIDSLATFGVDPDFTISIVFPEILRYSAIRDWAETKAIEVLYTQYGNKYADFSIGRFQMKPTFAEEIERQWNLHLQHLNPNSKLPGKFAINESENSRYERLKRLNDINWQLKYLAMFKILIEQKFKENKWSDIQSKLHFFATAYNSGFMKEYSSLLSSETHNDFYTGILKPSICYNYGNIAVDYFLKYRIL